MNRTYACRWCPAVFPNALECTIHEDLHRDIDYLNGEQPPAEKRRCTASTDFLQFDEYPKSHYVVTASEKPRLQLDERPPQCERERMEVIYESTSPKDESLSTLDGALDEWLDSLTTVRAEGVDTNGFGFSATHGELDTSLDTTTKYEWDFSDLLVFPGPFWDDLYAGRPTNRQIQTGGAPEVAIPAAAAAPRAPESSAPDVGDIPESPIPDSSVPESANPESSLPETEDATTINYDMQKVAERTFKNGVIDRHYQVTLRPEEAGEGEELATLHAALDDMFDGVLTEARRGMDGSDLGRVVIHHGDLTNPVVVPLRPLNELSPRVVTDHISAVLNSHQSLKLDGSFRVDVGTMELPKGGAKLPIFTLTGTCNSVQRKRSVVEIKNEDNTCLARAIAVAFLSTVLVTAEEWKRVHRDVNQPMEDQVLDTKKCPRWYYKKSRREAPQLALAKALCRRAVVSDERRLTLRDISSFEEFLDVDILVVASRAGNKFVRVPVDNGDLEEEEVEEMTSTRKRLYLYLVENGDGWSHYHAIINICGFFSGKKFCPLCLKSYDHRHQCRIRCFACKRDKGCFKDGKCEMSCRRCHVTCRSPSCFDAHLRGPNSQCDKWWKCTTCKRVVERKKSNVEEHVCGEFLCLCCHRYETPDHLCYIRSRDVKETTCNYIFFDFECRQEDVVECKEGYARKTEERCQECKDETYPCSHCVRCIHCAQSWCGKQEHVPNLVVAQKVCAACIDKDFGSDVRCDTCGTRCPNCSAYNNVDRCFEKEPCTETCGVREVVFKGEKTLQDFGRWLFHERHRGYKILSHNFKGYDSYPLLNYLLNNSVRPDKIIYAGSKIMYMHVSRKLDMTFIDSLNFLPMSLSKLPKAFGLEEVKKGYFPHLFNTLKNQDYVGPYPEPYFYGCDSMSTEQRSEFLQWHAETAGKTFRFSSEILDYCRSDVHILRKACLKFRSTLMDITGKKENVFDEENGMVAEQVTGGIDPFDSVTIASACMKIFKTLFLNETWRVKLRRGDEITEWLPATHLRGDLVAHVEGVHLNGRELQERDYFIEASEFVSSPISQIPSAGYTSHNAYSAASIRWLEWYMEESRRSGTPIHIQHALNGGEIVVSGTRYRLDGYCESTNTAFEFNGCYFHGCPICYATQRNITRDPRTKQSLEEKYTLTLRKRDHIESIGMNYIEMWEHDFIKLQKADEEAAAFIDALDIQDRLNPRDSFFGGRVNAMKLYHRAIEGEKIHYLDFCSLYPSVNKYAEYPVGHPCIITSDFNDIRSYFGIAKVKILPPRNLFHPVLPAKINNKLIFTLCRTCAGSRNQDACRCSDEQRSLLGTWCTPEIWKAVECGYQVQKIYEVYHWSEREVYDPASGTGGLFVEYINLFLKIKQEASGWPDDVVTEEEKFDYIRRYEEKEGIALDPEKVKFNGALRSIAKIMLNSFWGKFGEKLNKDQTTFYHESEADAFFRLLSDPSKEVTDFFVVAEDILQLSWKNTRHAVEEDFTTCVFLATFTSSFARLKLYEELQMLGERVLYIDTDSVVFISRHGDKNPDVGSYLGQLTSELCSDEYIVEFVSGGLQPTGRLKEKKYVRSKDFR